LTKFWRVYRSADFQSAGDDVILSKKDNKYFARVREWPEVIAEEATRDGVLHQVTAFFN
jgi:hypothetical protein